MNSGTATKKTASKHCDLPNLLFQQHCLEHYGINRGVFNTIELYMFNQGKVDIVQRRETMLDFFQFSLNKAGIRTGISTLKFGHGGLVDALNSYFQTNQI
ncbi:hypothetical protein [Paenibacillus periandrae]|uniref:hypothetical protein n=1 Tax=Paenibacillus periandrae TaxID=1761741 RepID=UPI001F09704E|nr:hypothetical protein [Paenibacillus periandrae]